MSNISLVEQLDDIVTLEQFLNQEEYNTFVRLLRSKKLTREENPEHHCCVFFIPYNSQTKEILIVHHKKAKQWVVPGGHIEKGELLEDAVRREITEELGMVVEKVSKPFLFSVMYIHNEGQACKAHYDIWYLIPTGQELNVDFREFNEVKWVNLQQAKELITHATYLKALERIENKIEAPSL